jgi:hypothetical protein
LFLAKKKETSSYKENIKGSKPSLSVAKPKWLFFGKSKETQGETDRDSLPKRSKTLKQNL